VRLLHEAGVVMVVGSDAPGPGITFGVTFHEELRNLVEVGLTPAEAIAAATSVAAEFLGVADRLGTIEPGKLADIIAVGGDPLADIRDASDIYMVIADGQVLYERLGEARRPRGVIAVAGGAFNTH
jgi:imidazolonepropionase-like amidohydrolase